MMLGYVPKTTATRRTIQVQEEGQRAGISNKIEVAGCTLGNVTHPRQKIFGTIQ